MSKKKPAAPNEPKTYPIHPDFKFKFKPAEAREKIREIMEKHLVDATYSQDNLSKWNVAIANEVRREMSKSLGVDKRYKFLIQIYSGENK